VQLGLVQADRRGPGNPSVNATEDRSPHETTAASSVADRVRSALVTPLHQVEDALIGDALRVQQVMLEDRLENPQAFNSSDSKELLSPLLYMEEQTRPFVEAVAAMLRYDESGALDGAILRAFDVIAEEPTLSGRHWEHAQRLRLYPLVLALFSLAHASVGRNDGRLLRRVLDLPLRIEDSRESVPLIWCVRAISSAGSLFNGAMGQRYYAPVAERISQIVPAWCADSVPGRRGQDVFLCAEFALALEHTRLPTFHGVGIPSGGTFAYHGEAQRILERLLRGQPKLLKDLFGEEVEKRLADFDANARRTVEGGFRRGFIDGAVAAWLGQSSPKS